MKTIGAGVFQSHALERHGPLRRSHAVQLVRFADDRARLKLDHAAQLDLHPVIGDKLQCDLEWSDGEWSSVAVNVTAVHRDGFVDVAGLAQPISDVDKPDRVRLRRYPEIKKRA